jgi:hypothetical protein
MAERSDLEVDWDASPRIIWVNWTDEDSRELTNQDLHDTCKGVLEYAWGAGDDPDLISSEGKAPLEGGQSVAITSTLLNAVVAFRENTTVVEFGTANADATGTILIDPSAQFVTKGVKPGASVSNKDDGSGATVLRILSETSIIHTALSNGTNNDWTAGDSYDIINVLGASLTGGNLVAQDALGDEIQAFLPTRGIFVTKTSSASATVQNLEDLEFASYAGAVHYDASATHEFATGVTHPSANQQYPVNTVPVLVTNAERTGLECLHITGDLTLGSGDDVAGYIIEGQTQTKTLVTIGDLALTAGTVIKNSTIQGILDGDCTLLDCFILDLNYVEGNVIGGILFGTIQLGGSADSQFIDCSSGVAGTATPEIDMNGPGRNLSMRKYAGGIRILNMTGATQRASVDFESGHLVIDSSCTDGTIVVRGDVHITNEALPDGPTVVHLAANNPADIAEAVWTSSLAGLSGEEVAGAILLLLRKLGTNDLQLSDGSSGNWEVLDDDSLTPIGQFDVTDVDGNPVQLQAGVPARRSKMVVP